MAARPHVRVSSKGGVNILAIYIEGYHFPHYYHWWESRLGKLLMKILSRKKYKHHWKCVYFDNMICMDEQLDPSMRKNILDCVMNWTYDLHEPENIKCFTVCDRCNRLCTIKFHFDHIPKCQRFGKSCTQC